jgi:hypothetical protein
VVSIILPQPSANRAQTSLVPCAFAILAQDHGCAQRQTRPCPHDWSPEENRVPCEISLHPLSGHLKRAHKRRHTTKSTSTRSGVAAVVPATFLRRGGAPGHLADCHGHGNGATRLDQNRCEQMDCTPSALHQSPITLPLQHRLHVGRTGALADVALIGVSRRHP